MRRLKWLISDVYHHMKSRFPSPQNRGVGFSLRRDHVNCVAGGKRLYHTIIPALLTDSATESQTPRLLAALGVMGAFMQPQGHVQVIKNRLRWSVKNY